MTEEQKDILLKDLCARLPYGVKMNHIADDEISPGTLIGIAKDMITLQRLGGYEYVPVEHYKPYLFPLSNMTKEQEDEWYEAFIDPLIERIGRNARQEDLQLQADAQAFGLECLLKNHFDIYGLIPMGLAIDATGLNVY